MTLECQNITGGSSENSTEDFRLLVRGPFNKFAHIHKYGLALEAQAIVCSFTGRRLRLVLNAEGAHHTLSIDQCICAEIC